MWAFTGYPGASFPTATQIAGGAKSLGTGTEVVSSAGGWDGKLAFG